MNDMGVGMDNDDGSVPTPIIIDAGVDREEKILNNLKRMIEEAPNDEMKLLWQEKYNTFLRALKRKVNNA